MKYCNYRDVTSTYSLNSQKLPGRFSYSLGTRLHTHMHTHTHKNILHSWGKRVAYTRAQIVYYIAENLELHNEVAQRIASMTGVCVCVCVCMRTCENYIVDSTQCTVDVRKSSHSVSVLRCECTSSYGVKSLLRLCLVHHFTVTNVIKKFECLHWVQPT